MLPPFDPSKMDPKLLMELSQLIQQLPPEQLNRMQNLMHNMMAGFDVHEEMAEFEKTLPPGFREKIGSLMSSGVMTGGATGLSGANGPNGPNGMMSAQSTTSPVEMDMREARLTILRGVATGSVSPDEAERLLFGD